MSRYYWLKLRRDFFKRHDIKIVEGMSGGKEIVLFYLKLLVESVDHDGTLRFSEAIPYTPDMLATITDTDPAIATQAIDVLKSLQLIETSEDGTIVLPQVLEMIGSAVDNDNAKRQAKHREKMRLNASDVTKNNATVTQNDENNNADVTVDVTKNNESKELDIRVKESDIRENKTRESSRFIPPSPDEVLKYMTDYCFSKGIDADPIVEAEKFVNHYTANGWRVGRNKMRDYKATARNWLLSTDEYKKRSPTPSIQSNPFGDL